MNLRECAVRAESVAILAVCTAHAHNNGDALLRVKPRFYQKHMTREESSLGFLDLILSYGRELVQVDPLIHRLHSTIIK